MQNGNYKAKANRAWEAAVTLVKLMKGRPKLHQEEAVAEVKAKHGNEFIYQNRNKNPAISDFVLNLFEMFTENEIVWAKHGRYWRKRQEGDPVDRREVKA